MTHVKKLLVANTAIAATWYQVRAHRAAAGPTRPQTLAEKMAKAKRRDCCRDGTVNVEARVERAVDGWAF